MNDESRLIFIHGLEGTSQGVKATLLRRFFPDILTPDFRGSLAERMAALEDILGEKSGWTIIGSSFGGLMGALYATQHPGSVQKLILLAPALIWPDFASTTPAPVDVPTVVYHGSRDEVIPLALVRRLAEQVFRNLSFHEVEDDHGLYKTVYEVNWPELVGTPSS